MQNCMAIRGAVGAGAVETREKADVTTGNRTPAFVSYEYSHEKIIQLMKFIDELYFLYMVSKRG